VSLSGQTAIKAFLETQGWQVPVATRRRPDKATLPILVVHGPLTSPRDRSAALGQKRVAQDYQVDIWQREFGVADPLTGKVPRVEDTLLPDLVAAALEGCLLNTRIGPSGGARIYRCTVLVGPFEIAEPDETNLIHHVCTVQMRRNLITHR
jgi:hypothetical protein